MNDTDRLSITFSMVINSYKRMLRMWQTIAFLLIILSLLLSSCIVLIVQDNDVQFRPTFGMTTVTMVAAGRILKKVGGKENNSLCTA